MPAARSLEAAPPNATLGVASGCGHLAQFGDPQGAYAFVREAIGAK